MVSFLELAPELLDTIVDYAAVDTIIDYVAVDGSTQLELRKRNTADLAALALTCQDLYQLAIPRLYRSFNQIENWNSPPPPHRLSRFLKTILDRPELAAKVQELHLVPYFSDDDEDEDEDEEEEDTNEEETGRNNSPNDTFITALQAMPWWQTWNEINDPRAREWIDATKAQNKSSPLCSILLHSVPNLQKVMVEITYSNANSPFFMEAVGQGVRFDANSSVPRFFGNLTELEIFTDSLDFNAEKMEIEKFLPIPSLKRVEVSQLHGGFGDTDPPPHRFSIESLELPRGRIKSWEKLLGPMKKLKNLNFTPIGLRGEYSIYEEASEMETSDIGRALTLVRKTLESWTLEEFNIAEDSDELSLLGSLKGFPMLRTLRIQLGLLIGTVGIHADTKELWELLPCNLEQLTLVGQPIWYPSSNKEDWVDQIIKVAVMRNSHFPQPQKLSVNTYSEEDKEKLEIFCAAKNFSWSISGNAQIDITLR